MQLLQGWSYLKASGWVSLRGFHWINIVGPVWQQWRGEEGGKEYESEGEGYAIGVNLNKDQRVERRDRYEMMDRRKADRFSLLPRRRVREREICSPGFSWQYYRHRGEKQFYYLRVKQRWKWRGRRWFRLQGEDKKKIIKKRYRYRVLSAGLVLEIRVLAVGKYS